MLDFHSHILPQMDDGSKSLNESLLMLKELKNQGISRVIATPHFYANDESVSDFLERRNKAYKSLAEEYTDCVPEILLGAEVRYYEGISRHPELPLLCIQGTNILLLEMPMKSWTEYNIRELEDIACSGKITLVLAHIERYIKLQKSSFIARLIESDVLFQINASFLNGFLSRRQALSLLKENIIHFIGSDCHNMAERKPDIGKAYEIIQKKLGNNFLEDFNNFGKNILDKKELSKG